MAEYHQRLMVEQALLVALEGWGTKHAEDLEQVQAAQAFLTIALDLGAPLDDRWARAVAVLKRCTSSKYPPPVQQQKTRETYEAEVLAPLARVVEEFEERQPAIAEALHEFQRVMARRDSVSVSWIRQAAMCLVWVRP